VEESSWYDLSGAGLEGGVGRGEWGWAGGAGNVSRLGRAHLGVSVDVDGDARGGGMEGSGKEAASGRGGQDALGGGGGEEDRGGRKEGKESGGSGIVTVTTSRLWSDHLSALFPSMDDD
jgi:hypothetical protein